MQKSRKITVLITLAAAFCFLWVSLVQTAPYVPTPEEEASYRIYSEYLIITHDDFYDQVVPLAEFKMENGLDVKVVRISEIGADPSAEEIADFIRDEYRRSIPYERPSCRLDAILQYVLLVGDVDYIPAHYRLNYGSATDYHATDLYYATIDSADYLPDIAVGRLPANSTTDVENMVNKIINYVPLTNRVLLFGNSPETDYADSDEPILTDAGFVVDKAYDATSCLETTNRINDGRLLAVYYGHGCVTGAGCALTESNIDELENTVLPVVLSGGCSNMYFDHSTETSLGELLVLMPEGGAIAFVGSTRTGGYGYQYSFVDGFSDELTDSAVLGRMLNSGRIAAYNAALDAGRDVGDGSSTQGHIEQINLLGDPCLSIEPVFVKPLPEFHYDPGRILPGDPPSARRFQDVEKVLR